MRTKIIRIVDLELIVGIEIAGLPGKAGWFVTAVVCNIHGRIDALGANVHAVVALFPGKVLRKPEAKVLAAENHGSNAIFLIEIEAEIHQVAKTPVCDRILVKLAVAGCVVVALGVPGYGTREVEHLQPAG